VCSKQLYATNHPRLCVGRDTNGIKIHFFHNLLKKDMRSVRICLYLKCCGKQLAGFLENYCERYVAQ
jgi:hypothetical protein